MQLPDNTTEEQRYQFEERAGICMDSHATKAESERMAYREVFGIEPPVDSTQAELI